MAPELSIPAREPTPASPAETSTQAVQNFLASLPITKPVASAQALITPLKQLNRRNLACDTRIQLLEFYRPMALKIAQGLLPLYCNASLPLPESGRDAAQLVGTLMTELAFGYKIAILERGKSLFGAPNNKALPLLAQRAIHALGQLATLSYQTYGRLPKNTWAELHQIYQLAAESKQLDTEVNDSEGKCSPGLAYQRVLLLFLAAPRHLSPADIDRVWAYLLRFGHLARLQALKSDSGTAGAFLIKPQSDTPPTPFNKLKGEADPASDLQLMTSDLTNQLASQISRLNANEAPKSLGLPTTVVDQRYQDLMEHLLKHWVQAPKRTFPRLNKHDMVSLCIGMPALHYFLNGEIAYALPVAPETDSEITEIRASYGTGNTRQQATAALTSAQWSVINESAGGLALARGENDSGGIRLGELVGLRTGKATQWSLCVERWAASTAQDGLEIGIQMLAPTATPVAIGTEGENDFEPALLLAEMTALKQAETMVTSQGGYRPARVIQLDQNGQRSSLLATRLIERTSGFERFEFSRL